MSKYTVTNEYINKDTYTIIKINNERYGNFEILIDNDDAEQCKSCTWYVNKYDRTAEKDYYYIVNGKGLLLHRFIMNAPKELVVDHKDGNKLDNRKQNLQICTVKENSRKSEFRVTNKSGHTGVIWYTKTNKWMSYIKVNYKFKNLGYFENIDDAIDARKKAEIFYFGDFKPISNCLENAISR